MLQKVLEKLFVKKIASEGMNVIMVGRREEMLKALGEDISSKYSVEHLVIKADFSDSNSADEIFEKTKDLDMGFMSYVACFHTFGKLQDTPWEKHEQMLNVNIITFLKCFYHYMGIFSKQDRGAIINVSSLTGISASPYNAQYGAGKSYILKLTEAVMKSALTPEDCVEEAFENLGKKFSIIAGEHNKANIHNWKANHTEDEFISYMGSFYER